MKLPNGYGSVSKLYGKRRKPWIVKVTKGWTDDGKQIRMVLGTFKTKSEGLIALAEYNKDPYDIIERRYTLEDLYNMLAEQRLKNNQKMPLAAYKHCSKLHKMQFRDIKTAHIQEIIDNLSLGYASKKSIKNLFSLLYKYAMSFSLVDRNYAKFIKLPSEIKSNKHKPFTEEELEILWKNDEDYVVKIALILTYTGLRPSELLDIKRSNVFLDKKYIIGGAKTSMGINRRIPIAEKIYPFIKDFYYIADEFNNPYLITSNKKRLPYATLAYKWRKSEISAIKNHLPHDGRHTCNTLLDNADVKENIKNLILGHVGKTINEKVYTHKTVEQLKEAIDLI